MVSEKTLTKISDCLFCAKALLFPDGRLRCSVDYTVARELCDSVEYGKARVWKPDKVVVGKLTRKPTKKVK